MQEEYQGLVPIPGVDSRFLSDGCSEVQQLKEKEAESDVVVEDIEDEMKGVPLVPPPSMFTPPSLSHKIHVSFL